MSSTGTATDPRADVVAEQAYVDEAYRYLAEMQQRAQRLYDDAAGADIDLRVALLRRVHLLRDTGRALCFGRLDEAGGDVWYVGRRHVEDDMGDPVVVEWRAPIAERFYRATHADPMGLVRRRQFVVDGRTLLYVGDDVFRGAAGTDVGDELRARDALLVELERARTGEMGDIVATIQPDQDAIIRAPLPGLRAVQGGPGSGKTAVALHRAAFLLFGNDALARAGVLVLGPNRAFLRYIAQVLPSLGEEAVVQTTLVDLIPEIDDPPPERPEVDRVKGDARMADLLRAVLAARRQPATDDLVLLLGLRRVVVRAEDVNEVVATIASRRVPYADGRRLVRDKVLELVRKAYGGAQERAHEAVVAARRTKELGALVDRVWPSVTSTGLVADLFRKANDDLRATAGLLDPDERALLVRAKPKAWTAADIALLDEAQDLVHGRLRTYGHVVVDEAQDLSPMQLRMMARRCPSGSMTLLGDLAQGFGVWARDSWADAAAHLPNPETLQVEDLRYAYRSPAQVLDLANRLLPEIAPDIAPSLAVRPGRHEPVVRRVAADDLVDAAAIEAARLSVDFATVGVIVPGPLVDRVVQAVRDLDVDAGDALLDGLSQPVSVMAGATSRGLEFDAAIVVEPAAIAEEAARGFRLLYVALTRPTQHLVVLHARPLPEALAR